jgi:glycosyltransferase involved in cell wall biosynthesis
VVISVIIPTYNCGLYIAKTIDSVLLQKSKKFDLDIIVVDDGSTDNTYDIVTPYTSRYANIRYRRIKSSGNPGRPRNVAVSMAKGEYLAFVDADDIWLPGKLEKQIELFSDPDIGLTWTNAQIIDPSGKLMKKQYLKTTQLHKGHVFNELAQDNFVITSSSIVPADVIKKVGLFMENDKFNVCQDYDLWLRIAQGYKLAYLSEPLIQYRHHPQGISKRNAVHALRDIIIVLKHQLNYELSKDQRHAVYGSLAHKYRAKYDMGKFPWRLSSYLKGLYFRVLKKVYRII